MPSSSSAPSTDRWWAPQRPTVEPDAVVLAMLEPGDIGSSMLAVHRAGAAAIATVSKGAVPSEPKLVAAMVQAREAVASRVVDSVSKAASPSYAGLFVMDVFDDAEEGALAIYRSAVTKGVSPPVAAQRAGDIFGVPSKLMGKYAVLATDPKSNPVTVRDLADRTLLEHVGRVAELEGSEVSKADDQAYQERPGQQRPWRESDVLRDAFGRFADEAENAPPPGSLEAIRRQLGLTGTPNKVAGQEVAPERQKRRTRNVRRQRVTRRVVATGQQAKATGQRVMQRVVQTAEAKRAAVRAAQQQAIAREVNRAAAKNVEDNEAKALTKRPKKPIGDVLAAFPSSDHQTYGELDSEIVLRTDLGDGARFRDAVRSQGGRFRNPNEQIFRLGHFMEGASRGTAEHPGTKYDVSNREALADTVAEDLVRPNVEVVHAYDLESSFMSEGSYLEKRKGELADSHARFGVEEIDHTVALPVYRPYGSQPDLEDTGAYAIVHYNPANPNEPDDRDMPTIEEFVLLGNPRGSYEGTTKQPAIELDPNEVYRVVHNPNGPQSGMKVETMWDAEHGVAVNRYYLEAITEYELEGYLAGGDVKKADQYAYQPRPSKPWRESDVVRDAFGRFADESDEEAEEAPVAERRVRQARRQRVTRRATAAPAQREARRADPKRAAQQRGGQRVTGREIFRAIDRMTARVVVERLEDEDDDATPVLFDQSDFKVLTQHQWARAINLLDNADMDALFARQPIKLDSVTRRSFAEFSPLTIDELPTQLSRNVDDDPSLRNKQFQVIAHMAVPEFEAAEAIGRRIDRLIKDHPEVDKLEVLRIDNSLQFAVNKVPAQHQSIIEVHPDTDLLDMTAPVYLRYVGQYRGRNIGVRNPAGMIGALSSPHGEGDGDYEGVVLNPTIHLYRLTN